MEDNHCVRTVHAEANAIVQAARNGAAIDNSSIYVPASPCWGCFRLIANAGEDKNAIGYGSLDPSVLATVFNAPAMEARRINEPDPYSLYLGINTKLVTNVKIRQAVAWAIPELVREIPIKEMDIPIRNKR